MAFYDLGNLVKLGHDILVHCAALEVYADVCAGGVTEQLGVYRIARACDDAKLDHTLDSLVYGSA